MFKSDSLLLLTKINTSIKAIKNMTKIHLKKMRNLLILYCTGITNTNII